MNRIVKTMTRLVLTLAGIAHGGSVDAQVLGTFRWNTAPYCNVLVLTVTQVQPTTFRLEGVDEQCGGNPRQPVQGSGVLQSNGTVTFGLNVTHQPGDVLPMALRATVDMGTLAGTWQDGGGSNGALVFSPAAVTGGPRPALSPPFQPSNAFRLLPRGGFAAVRGDGAEAIPVSGFGTRMMFWAERGAFRAGQVSSTQWDAGNVGIYSTALGGDTVASAPYAVATGQVTSATALGAMALGYRAWARHDGTFVFGDRSAAVDVQSNAANQFVVRAAGGTRFYSNAALSAGVALAPGGGSFINLSDAAKKANFRDLDGDTVLGKLAAMPIREWNYTSQPASVRHVGPTAQDFAAAFGLGEDPLGISTVDGIGIALRAVQALEVRLRALEAGNRQLLHDNAALRARSVLATTLPSLPDVATGPQGLADGVQALPAPWTIPLLLLIGAGLVYVLTARGPIV